MKPKPDIILAQDQWDPNHNATRRHFNQLFNKFSYPIYIFNLTKKKNQRELVVSNEYVKVVNDKINKELPKELKIIYHHYDVKAKKKEERNFPFGIFDMAKEAISKIGIFKIDCSQPKKQQISIQRGVIRTNCIDSLDRTNFVQELTGYVAILE